MNRFTVTVENAADIEALWLGRDSRLHEMDGFVEFDMLKGPEEDGHRLYASHTVWRDEDAFRAWTTSTQFRAAHARAGDTRTLHAGAPRFEAFTSIQTKTPQDRQIVAAMAPEKEAGVAHAAVLFDTMEDKSEISLTAAGALFLR